MSVTYILYIRELLLKQRRRWRQRKRHCKKVSAFPQSFSRLFQLALSAKCKLIFSELVSWGPNPSLEGEKKISCGEFTSSVQRSVREFHGRSHAVTAKKCTKKPAIRAELLFCWSKSVALLTFSLPFLSSLGWEHARLAHNIDTLVYPFSVRINKGIHGNWNWNGVPRCSESLIARA